MTRTILTTFAASCLLATLLPAQGSPTGTWHGTIDIMGQSLKIEVRLAEGDGQQRGVISIPQQGAVHMNLMDVEFDEKHAKFALKAGMAMARFDGKCSEKSIAGEFKQGLAKGTFTLTRGPLPRMSEGREGPYKDHEVTVPCDGHQIAGTLTIPEGDGPFPALVLITGSGPQDRDEVVGSFGVFHVLTDHLARNGIATLAYDDRGVGESTGEFKSATTMDLAKDAQSVFEFALTRPELDSKRIGLLGHSEGGLICPFVAKKQKNVAFVVLMAGTAVSGRAVLEEQLVAILKAQGMSDEDITAEKATQAMLLDVASESGNLESSKERLLDHFRTALKKNPSTSSLSPERIEKLAKETMKTQVESVTSPWFRQFLTLDPRPALEKLRVPTLALFGQKDTQVLPTQNAPVMKEALAENDHAEIHIIDDANHLFQVAKTGAPVEYATLKKEFHSEFLKVLTSWLQQRQ